jgi:ubiquinone biosynthesis protein COQ4
MARANRIRPLEARRAMKALSENPDDTAQAFRVIGALAGNSGARLFRRFRRSPDGAEVLREHRELFSVLDDVERLKRMPEGSLGAAVANYFITEELSAQGLADASEAAFQGRDRGVPDSDEALFGRRLRDLHDVFHVVTGYGRDVRGEAAVLAFTVPQTRNPGVAYIVGRVLMRAGWNSEMGRLIRSAFMRGMRANWLVDKDWETWLERPLEEVRAELNVGPPPDYEAIRSAGAPILEAS